MKLKSYDLFFMNEDEIRMYVNCQMARMDYETAMSEREAEGIEKGKAIGIQKTKENNFIALLKKA